MSVSQVNKLLDRIETMEERLRKQSEYLTGMQVFELADILRATLLIVRAQELGREARQDREGA
jgi:hypothetical protein